MRVEKELDETDFFFFDINQVKDSIKIKRLKERRKVWKENSVEINDRDEMN